MSVQFKIIYKILSILEKSMDCEELDVDRLSPEALNITYAMWTNILTMLYEEKLIKGIVIKKYVDEAKPVIVNYRNIQITMRGLAYLEENSLMLKAKNLAKGIVDIVK